MRDSPPGGDETRKAQGQMAHGLFFVVVALGMEASPLGGGYPVDIGVIAASPNPLRTVHGPLYVRHDAQGPRSELDPNHCRCALK